MSAIPRTPTRLPKPFPLWSGGGRVHTIPRVARPVSIAIETSCRRGGVALGAGGKLIESAAFRADRRHAVQLVAHMDDLLRRHGLAAKDVEELYVSIGPGSFTGLRVGVTVARTMAQAVDGLRLVAVPTVLAVARSATSLGCDHLAVVMDAKFGNVYAARFACRDGRMALAGDPLVLSAEKFVAECPRPITLIGEGLGYHRLVGDGITIGDESLWLPRPEGVWAAGCGLAQESQFIDLQQLRPLYLRQPEAVRLWEQRRD